MPWLFLFNSTTYSNHCMPLPNNSFIFSLPGSPMPNMCLYCAFCGCLCLCLPTFPHMPAPCVALLFVCKLSSLPTLHIHTSCPSRRLFCRAGVSRGRRQAGGVNALLYYYHRSVCRGRTSFVAPRVLPCGCAAPLLYAARCSPRPCC